MATINVENNARTRGRPFQTGQPNPGFKPGQSGNPGGRPKGLAKLVRELVGEDGEMAIAVFVEIMCDQSASNRDRMAAADWLVCRGWGKAVDYVDVEDELTGPNGYPMLDLDKLTTEQLDQLLDLYDAARPDAT